MECSSAAFSAKASVALTSTSSPTPTGTKTSQAFKATYEISLYSQNLRRTQIHSSLPRCGNARPRSDGRKALWSSNVDGTRNVAEACRSFGVATLVFTSTNCLWGSNLGHAVAEDEPSEPIEIYGRSKLAAEEALADYRNDLNVIIVRCPTIIDSGRLGLLAILFEFIQDGKKVWVVDGGANRYQFIYAQDLATACLLAMNYPHSDIFHIGSDDVKPLRAVYDAVIAEAKSKSRVTSLPKGPAIAAMKLAHKLGVSPLGRYHYQMIAEDFLFDTAKIKAKLGWRPTLTNEQMLVRAYQYYAAQRAEIHARRDVSAHSKPASMGVIRLLKWIS